MQKQDLALNNQQWLICHKAKPNQNAIKVIMVCTSTWSGARIS